jgi:RecA-family ATPase
MDDFTRRMQASRARIEAERISRLDPPPYLNGVPPIGADEPPLEPIEFLHLAAWDNEPVPPREWAVPECIPLRQPTLFSGEGAAGKSKILLQLSCAHVLGKYWLGLAPELGPAIYLGAEDDADEIHRRIADCAQHYETTFSDLQRGGLHLLSLAGHDAILGVSDRRGVIRPTLLFKRLREAALDIKPKLIGLDTSSDIYAGEENDRSQVRQFFGLLRGLAIESNSAVVVCAHPSLTGISSGTGLSGSTAWHNSVRARMYLKPAKTQNGEEPDKDRRELEFIKNNYGRLGDSIQLKWEKGVFVRLQAPGSLERAAAEQRAEEVFLKVLDRFNAQDRYVNNNIGHWYAPAAFANEPEVKAAQISKERLAQAMTRLFTANRVHLEPHGPPSRKRFRLVSGAKP